MVTADDQGHSYLHAWHSHPLEHARLGNQEIDKSKKGIFDVHDRHRFFSENTYGHEPVGETECNEYLRKKTLGKNMKSVRPFVLQSLNEGAEGLEIQVSKPMVKALALLALQPMACGYSFDKVEYDVVAFHEVFFKQPVFMVCYAAVFLMLGFFLGYFFNKEIANQKFAQVLNWASGQIESAKKNIEYVDDWDPDTQSLRQYNVSKPGGGKIWRRVLQRNNQWLSKICQASCLCLAASQCGGARSFRDEHGRFARKN